MSTRYLAVAELKAYVRSELTLADALYEAAINTGEMSLDNALCRRMEVASPTVSSARVYKPTCSDLLVIHDAVAIISVVDNGTTLVAGTDYQAEPLNGLSVAGEPTPYYMLRRLFGCWHTSWASTANSQATITVTARWGWPAIPVQVKESCKIIAKDAFQQRDVSFGLVAVTEAGGVGTRENRIVHDTIEAYAHPNAFGVA